MIRDLSVIVKSSLNIRKVGDRLCQSVFSYRLCSQ